MDEKIVVNFNPKPCINRTEPRRITLGARTEIIVIVPTNYMRIGSLAKNEILTGVYRASALTRGEIGVCVTNIIYMTEGE